MFTVFIADDEAKVISGLIHRVNWKKLDAWAVGYAENGKEAKEKILELRPDIVITDIYMPGMTGIELINELSDTVDTVFIIFSAYSEFEYAREAIHLNVVEYLVKPASIREIETALTEARSRVEEKRRNDVWRKEEYVLMKLLDGADIPPEELPLEQGNAVIAIAVEFEDGEKALGEAEQTAGQWKLINGKVYTLRRKKRLIIIGVQKNYDTDGGLRRWLLMRVRDLFSEEGPAGYWGMGMTAESWKDLDQSVYSAEEMLDYSKFYQSQVEDPGAAAVKAAEPDDIMSYGDELILHLEDAAAAAGILDKIRASLREIPRDTEEVKVKMIEFLYQIRKGFEETSRQKIAPEELNWERDVVYKLMKAHTLDQVLEVLEAAVAYFQRSARESQSAFTQSLVGRIQSYIRRNLHREIVLNDIAQYIGRNPTYVSHIFRAETGETLFEYITRLRMERAIQLLLESRLKIQEIAAAVGYEEQSYFCQVFKKYTGRTAGSYRKMQAEDKKWALKG